MRVQRYRKISRDEKPVCNIHVNSGWAKIDIATCLFALLQQWLVFLPRLLSHFDKIDWLQQHRT